MAPRVRKSSSFDDTNVIYSPKMINMWANRYIEISKKAGNAEAKAWATKYVPQSCMTRLKKLIEEKLKIRRPEPSDPKAT